MIKVFFFINVLIFFIDDIEYRIYREENFDGLKEVTNFNLSNIVFIQTCSGTLQIVLRM